MDLETIRTTAFHGLRAAWTSVYCEGHLGSSARVGHVLSSQPGPPNIRTPSARPGPGEGVKNRLVSVMSTRIPPGSCEAGDRSVSRSGPSQTIGSWAVMG